MKILFPFFGLTAATLPNQALANSTSNSGEGGLAVILLLGLIGVIIIGQLIPGCKLFFAILKGLFNRHSTQINSTNKRVNF